MGDALFIFFLKKVKKNLVELRSEFFGSVLWEK